MPWEKRFIGPLAQDEAAALERRLHDMGFAATSRTDRGNRYRRVVTVEGNEALGGTLKKQFGSLGWHFANKGD